MFSSLTLDSNKEVTNCVSTRISSEKIKSFEARLESTMSNSRAILQVNNSVLVQKSSSSLSSNFILSFYMVYELTNWPRNPINNFALAYCLFATVKLTTNADKSKFTYNGRGIAFDREGLWSFGNDFARNVLITPHHFILIIK